MDIRTLRVVTNIYQGIALVVVSYAGAEIPEMQKLCRLFWRAMNLRMGWDRMERILIIVDQNSLTFKPYTLLSVSLESLIPCGITICAHQFAMKVLTE